MRAVKFEEPHSYFCLARRLVLGRCLRIGPVCFKCTADPVAVYENPQCRAPFAQWRRVVSFSFQHEAFFGCHLYTKMTPPPDATRAALPVMPVTKATMAIPKSISKTASAVVRVGDGRGFNHRGAGHESAHARKDLQSRSRRNPLSSIRSPQRSTRTALARRGF